MMNTLSSLISRYVLPASEEEVLSAENLILIRFLAPAVLCLGVFNAFFFLFYGVGTLKVFGDTLVYFIVTLFLFLIGRTRISENHRAFLVEFCMAIFMFFVITQYYPLVESVVWTISTLFIVLSMCRCDNRLIFMIMVDLLAAAVFVAYRYPVALEWAQIVTLSITYAGLMGCAVINSKIRNAQVKELVNRRQEALALVEKLQITDKNKNTFLSSLSHELRNPLATITAGLQLMDMSSDAASISETKEIIKSEVKQLTNLVDDLLDVTRIVTNRVVLRKEIVCLNDICLSRANAFKLLYMHKQIGLEIRITDDPVCIEADPVRISQIIGNLLHNALKFTEEGKGYVRFDMHVENREAVLCVCDNGIGIEPQIMPSIFEPFVQGESVLDRTSSGLGLGLPIVKAMTELHGGRVHAYSAGTPKGSSFFIYLPLMPTDVANC